MATIMAAKETKMTTPINRSTSMPPFAAAITVTTPVNAAATPAHVLTAVLPADFKTGSESGWTAVRPAGMSAVRAASSVYVRAASTCPIRRSN